MSSFSILSSSPANTSPRRRALIADERASFYRSWNATTIAHARGSQIHPYPPPSSVFMRANTAKNSDEDFSDLGVTARRKLERLQGSVFAHSLLERGTYHAMEGIEVYNGPIEVSMGYTSSVGIMLAEEIALTNDLVGAVSVTTRGTVARVSELEDTIRGLETIVRRLKRSHESLRIFTEMELANRDLTIGLMRARLNAVTPMEIDLTTVEDEEEYISAPGTPPTSGHTSTTDVSIRMSSFSILSSSPANISPRRRALIADERASFFRSWNATTIAHARGSRIHPYPPPSSVFMRANTAENCDEDFSDLGVNDFVLSHKVTARRKLERLQGSVFARSLLERGTYHAMEGIEVYNGPIEVSMGYTSSVGIMLAEEIALTNDLVGAVSVTTRGTVARVSELEDTVRGLETIVRRLKRSHEALKVFTEMELANRDLTIGLMRARLNAVAPMEIDLTTVEDEEEYISAPGTPPTSGHTSTTDVSIRVETPELVIPEGVLIPIEDDSEEDGEGEVVIPDEIEAPEPVGIILPRHTFNWQDERAQGQEDATPSMRREWPAVEDTGRSFGLKKVEMFFKASEYVGERTEGMSWGTVR
ncbi:hypothetical protein BDM02DRAFT_3133197 [Thelephora ganbajun]|uniref:Uncharacterized protein n=1 Tax=Thelephora ganbajun TaxID=370292 RepID=A0ACB6YYB0_THEGA|nr:hypothetical protein BDM02DRAFT_3133197 [Thelephora ganbajun]